MGDGLGGPKVPRDVDVSEFRSNSPGQFRNPSPIFKKETLGFAVGLRVFSEDGSEVPKSAFLQV